MKIKVIQLLNKIANGEEVPEKILIRGYEYNLVKRFQTGNIYDGGNINFAYEDDFENYWLDMAKINDEIEIIEEDKEIEELGYFNLCKSNEDREDLQLTYTGVADTFDDVYEKINELVKAVNELKKGK
jgi:hypothetical protein